MKAKVTLTVTLQEPNGTTRDWVNVQEGNFDSDDALTAYVLTKIAKVFSEQGILEQHSPTHSTFIPWSRVLKVDSKAEILSSLDLGTDVAAAKHAADAAKAADDLIRGNGTIEFPTGAKTGKGYKN